MPNQDIRMAAKGAGVPLWKIAQAMNVSEQTIIRWLREELTLEQKKNYLSIIERLKVGA